MVYLRSIRINTLHQGDNDDDYNNNNNNIIQFNVIQCVFIDVYYDDDDDE